MRNQLDLTAFLRSIGVKGSEGSLDLLGVLQPSVIVADLSALASPILPPSSLMGGFQAGTVANVPVMSFTNLSKGGSWLRFGADTQAAINHLRFNVTDAPLVLPAPTLLVNIRTAHQPSLVVGVRDSILRATADAAFNDDLHPTLMGAGFARGPVEPQPIYIPSGFTFEIAAKDNGAASQLIFSSLWQDVPVPPPADALTATLA